MNLDIKFGIDLELGRVKDTLAEMDWFDANGYSPILPAGIGTGSSEAEIRRQITKEFKQPEYEEAARRILADFATKYKLLPEKLAAYFKGDIPANFIVRLVAYGVGGSYDLPNIIVFNIHGKKGPKVIVHEIIHLLLEAWIQKFRVQHWEKERIVDLILNSKEFSFLGYGDWQNDYHNVEQHIDDLFKRYFFEDREIFFSKLEELRIVK